MRSFLLALALLLQGPQAQAPGSIEGVVVRVGTGTPVPGARVSMGPAQTATDESGRFSFRNVPPGLYRLAASHNDYTPAGNGDRSAGRPDAGITVGPRQEVTGVVLALTPKGAISGRVYDRNDAAVKNASIQALKHAYQDGRRILVPVGTAATDDLGEYRMPSLASGAYVIRAGSPGSPTGDVLLPVYFPNTVDASTASVIDLPPGVDLTGVDLRLTETRAVRLRGQMIDGTTGQPAAGGPITLVPRRGTVATGSLQRTVVSSAGTFEFRDMAPGSYDLIASGRYAGGTSLAASASVEIAGADIDNVTLVLQPQLSIDGRISIENASADFPAMGLGGIRVELRREPYTPELLIPLPAVGGEGTFALNGVTPGEYRLKVTTGQLRGYVKSARYGAIDALNPPFSIHGPGQFEIIISLSSGSLHAAVVDDSQKPFADATVVLVPDPPNRQRFDLYYVAGSNASGRVDFQNVAPGNYRIFAWDDVPADAWQDPEFLRPFENRGRTVRISEGQRETVEARLIR